MGSSPILPIAMGRVGVSRGSSGTIVIFSYGRVGTRLTSVQDKPVAMMDGRCDNLVISGGTLHILRVRGSNGARFRGNICVIGNVATGFMPIGVVCSASDVVVYRGASSSNTLHLCSRMVIGKEGLCSKGVVN